MAAKRKKMVGVDSHLPRELRREILNRLPVRSILRFRSVCKSCYSLISSPDFTSDYSARNLNKNVLLQFYDFGVLFGSFSYLDKSSMEHDEVPEVFLRRDPKIVGSCNGLICLSSHWLLPAIRFLIWNPTIRKIVELPSFGSPTLRPVYLGFGFDSKANDFKVMCFVAKSSYLNGEQVCAIFDLRKRVWRVISPPPVCSWFVRSPPDGYLPECYLDGAVHWIVHKHANSFDKILLSFDMTDERFREIKMPDNAEFNVNDRRIKTQSVAFGGLIHVIVWRQEGYSSLDCSVWAMKEYGIAKSWIKVFNIDLQSVRVWPNHCCLWDNDELLMVYDDKGTGYKRDLGLYNAWTGEFKHLHSSTRRFLNICLYEESLILM